MEQGPARRPALPAVSIAAVGAGVVSLTVVAVPWLRMSFEAPSLRVALETGGALVAVTTVGLLVRQCGLRSRADHLVADDGADRARRDGARCRHDDRRRGLVTPRGALRHVGQPRGHADARDRGARADAAVTSTPLDARAVRRRPRVAGVRGRPGADQRRAHAAGVRAVRDRRDARGRRRRPRAPRGRPAAAALGRRRRRARRRSPSSTTRSSRRSARTTCTSATSCGSRAGSPSSPACWTSCAPACWPAPTPPWTMSAAAWRASCTTAWRRSWPSSAAAPAA